MKVVILCGGQGTRLREQTEVLPKPMVDIGGRPIVWHIMKTYAHFGLSEFVLCLGYKDWKKDVIIMHPKHKNCARLDSKTFAKSYIISVWDKSWGAMLAR